MFRFFIFINLILVHVFCQTTEDNLQFNTDSPTTESWQQDTTAEQTWQLDTNYDTTQSWDQLTTEQPLELSTQSWNEGTTEQPSELSTQSWNEGTTEQPSELSTQSWNEGTTEQPSELSTQSWNEGTTEQPSELSTQSWNEGTTEQPSELSTQSWNEGTTEQPSELSTQSWNEGTTEQPSELSTQSWNEGTTEQPLELSTNFDTTQSQEQITTEESLELNNESDTTQTWQEFTTEKTSEEENFNTTQQITSTVSTMSNATFPPGITCDMLEEIKKEILDVVLLNISREINGKLEALEVLLSALNCSNVNTSSAIELSWQIYENLQIPLTGWLRVFDQPYTHKTRTDDLNQIAGICHNEVLIGATYNGSITLAAVGPASVLTINTPWNQPQQFGEVYWYRTNGLSFGFSPNSIIRQTSADNQDLDSSVRLSWLLDQNMGGYRVGVARSLANNSFWHKVIYCN